MTFADTDFPALPYPGARPPCSFAHVDATGYPLVPDPAALSGWRLGAEDLDGWLADRGAAPLAGRVPLLCYGSNACPTKLTWLRTTLGLTGPAVLLRARTTGLAAVWAAGLRLVDDQRPATLAALPGEETHAVWLATPDQFAVLDRCEGRGNRYRLAHVTTGEVRLEDGTLAEHPLAYVANYHPADARTNRFPLLVGGHPVRCADVPQAAAAALAGEPAASDGLAVLAVDGTPVPDALPRRLFVYGTLAPGASQWSMIAGHVTGEPRRARLPGTLYDTGFGYPALSLAVGPGVPGWLVELTDAAAILSTVDGYEGAGFRRVRVTLDGGTQAWTYVWTGPVEGMRTLAEPWASR
jgi:gamma-glutamylcyclotransferase (GGCT)/AIG2-like uncharacterized protein YtfP